MIGVKRIYLPLFHLTCTLGTSSGRNPGRCTVLFARHGDQQGRGRCLKGEGCCHLIITTADINEKQVLRIVCLNTYNE